MAGDEVVLTSLQRQLAEGNAGAQGYFGKRVEIYLKSGDAASLAKFLEGFWPAYKQGVEDLWRRAKANAIPYQ